MWPGGYCSSMCRPSRNDAMTGINPDCPGGSATCVSAGGATGQCETTCPNFSGMLDCRTGYSCFSSGTQALTCEPTALSQCDPKRAGSCPSDADAGTTQTCVNVGDGTVGECFPGCDPFTAKSCNQSDPNMFIDCHASDQTGEGLCIPPGTDAAEGMPCG